MVDFWDPHSSFIGRRAFVCLIVVHNFTWTAFWLLAGLVNGSTTGRTVTVFAKQRSPFRGHRYIRAYAVRKQDNKATKKIRANRCYNISVYLIDNQ